MAPYPTSLTEQYAILDNPIVAYYSHELAKKSDHESNREP